MFSNLSYRSCADQRMILTTIFWAWKINSCSGYHPIKHVPIGTCSSSIYRDHEKLIRAQQLILSSMRRSAHAPHNYLLIMKNISIFFKYDYSFETVICIYIGDLIGTCSYWSLTNSTLKLDKSFDTTSIDEHIWTTWLW